MSPPRSTLSRIAGVITFGYSDSPGGRILLRRGASRAVRLGLRLRSRHLSPDGLATVLVLAPHPDDEALGCGGTLALLVRAGARVHVAYLTDGGASHPDHPLFLKGEIGALRRDEARSGARALGIDLSHLEFLGLEDGRLASLDPEETRQAVAAISSVIAKVAPDAVLLPCRRDGSSEHDAAFGLVVRSLGVDGKRPRLFEFPVWSWWNPVLLIRPLLNSRRVWRTDTSGVRELKARAVISYASQVLPLAPETSAVLPPGFASMFTASEEYLFEC
jgi:LmbE family N-acetylglucosaminyl deacetylase